MWTAGRPSWTPSSHLKSSKANCLAFFVVGVLVPHSVAPSRTAATQESIFTPNENSTQFLGLIRLKLGVEHGRISVMQGRLPGRLAENKPKLLESRAS